MKRFKSLEEQKLQPSPIGVSAAFFTGTFMFSMLYSISGISDFAYNEVYFLLLGLIGGLITSLPRSIKFFKAVKQSNGIKKLASMHMVLNLTTMLLFAAALLFAASLQLSHLWVTLIEAVGFISLCCCVGIGTLLTYRHYKALGVAPVVFSTDTAATF